MGLKSDADLRYLDGFRPSRIRDLARGHSYWASVDILALDVDQANVIRTALEPMGVQVSVFRAGLAQHVVNVLSGEVGSSEYVLLACHGDDGAIVLPELADVVAATQRWNGRLTPDDLRSFLKIDGRIVIGLGCDMGHEDLARVFLESGCRAYIGPQGAPFGYASALFPILLFYELTELRTLDQAVERIRAWDSEFAMWRLYKTRGA